MDENARKTGGPIWLPNVITGIRIFGSPVLVVLAREGHLRWLAALVVFLVFTEWADGFLARRMRASSPLGARLDTIADAVFYSSLLVAVMFLNPTVVDREKFWIIPAVASYLLSWSASWLKFHFLPSYHTWAAKGVWVIIGVGVVLLMMDTSPWPFRVAMVGVVITNLEAFCITMVLRESKVDVPSLLSAWRIAHQHRSGD